MAMNGVETCLQEAGSVETAGRAACYFPLSSGRYEVKPGLMPFGTDFGNGLLDRQVFQLDDHFPHYRQMKLLARAERLSKYYQTCNYSETVAGAIVQMIVDRLVQEHPRSFWVEPLGEDEFALHSRLTGERICLNLDGQLLQAMGEDSVMPPYRSALDALAAQVQEDLAVICRAADGKHWLGAVHLCYPNHWSAEEKIGKDFGMIHAPVAGMGAMNRRGSALVHTMIARRPMVRFAWGLSMDTRLNHHPEPPSTVPIALWQGRQFDRRQPRLYLRIERQVIWGLPGCDAALFSIRTSFRDCAAIKADEDLRSSLCAAIRSMSRESLIYKGLAASQCDILDWLEAG